MMSSHVIISGKERPQADPKKPEEKTSQAPDHTL
jgi:hypothetical protein